MPGHLAIHAEKNAAQDTQYAIDLLFPIAGSHNPLLSAPDSSLDPSIVFGGCNLPSCASYSLFLATLSASTHPGTRLPAPHSCQHSCCNPSALCHAARPAGQYGPFLPLDRQQDWAVRRFIASVFALLVFSLTLADLPKCFFSHEHIAFVFC